MKTIKTTFNQLLHNKRMLAAISVVLAIVCLFGPFAQLSFSGSVSVPFVPNSFATKTNTVATVNLGDFATFKTIGDIKIRNKPINRINVFGVSVYETLKNPPNLSKSIDQAVTFLNPVVIESMRDPKLEQQLIDLAPNFGQDLFGFLKSTSQLLETSRELLVTIQPAVHSTDDVLIQVSDALHTAEFYHMVINASVFALFVLIALSAVLFALKQVPILFPRLLLWIGFGVVIALLIVVPVLNSQINAAITDMTTQFNANMQIQVNTLINNLIGEKAGFLALIIQNNTNVQYVQFQVNLGLGWGAMLASLFMVLGIILSFLVPRKETTPVQDIEETVEPTNEITTQEAL